MANPGKTYNLPCSLLNEWYSSGTGKLAWFEKIKLGKRYYRINGYLIDIDYEDSYKAFLFEQASGSGEWDY